MYSFFCDFFFGPHSHSTSKTAISLRTMSSETKESDAGFRSFSYEEELQRAKWFKEDLERGGWADVHNSPGISQYWMKTFYDQPVPIKTLFTLKMPVPGTKVVRALDPSNMEHRRKWDQAFLDNEVFEKYPEKEGGGHLIGTRVKVSCPFKDRSFVVFVPPAKEVDWYGQKAFLLLQKNAWHHSKPPGADGFVRATNGGNFTIVIPEEKNPDGEYTVFALRNNNYNGWLPKTGIQFILSRQLPTTFNLFRENIIEACNKYFKNDD